jgi:hypothetical protein
VTPEKCPGCGAKLRPEMLACPNCPMSFPEDDGPVGATNPLKQSRYYQFVFPLLFFGSIGAIVWYLGAGLMHLGYANSEVETGNLFGGSTKPAAPARTSAGEASGSGEKPADGEKAPDDGGMVSIVHVDDDASASAASRERRAPPPEVVTEWKLRGTIYDLTTLKPLPGVEVTFADEATNSSIKTRTDSAGRYRAIVPPLDGRGYAVAMAKNGYAPNYLDPGTEGVREKDASERRTIARDLSSSLGAAPATIQSVSAKPLVTDFYLAPRL